MSSALGIAVADNKGKRKLRETGGVDLVRPKGSDWVLAGERGTYSFTPAERSE
jgi:hypothetical protein